MKLLFLGTINGKFDEGMRNVATHIGECLEKEHTVRYVQLKDVFGLIKYLMWCDHVLVCARADKKRYLTLRLITTVKKASIILVQKPTEEYLSRCKKHPIQCNYLTISIEDALCIPHLKNEKIKKIDVGIDSEKFSPVNAETQKLIKQELGLDPSKPVIIHVGHCSSGRKVEKLCLLDPTKYQRLVITSGMFEDSSVRRELENNGVKLLSGYIPNIEKYYQAADVYFFPTDSGDYVISIPLSVMEALSAGTPVVGFDKLSGLKEIEVTNPKALQLISGDDEIGRATEEAVKLKTTTTYLKCPRTWLSVANEVSKKLEGFS